MNNSIWNFAEADLGVLVKTKLNMNKQCAPATKTANDELCCTKHPLLFSSGETTGVQCPVLDSLVQEKHGESPVKRHEDSKGTGASLLWAQAERAATLAWRRSRRIFLMDIYFWRKGANRTEPGSFQCCLVTAPELMGTNWSTEYSIRTSGNTFHCEGDWTLPQVAQEVCGVSILGKFKSSLNTPHGKQI